MTRPVVEHYDERAATYDESAMHRDLADAVAEVVGDPGAGLVLDVATGTGLVARAIGRVSGPHALLGVDLSPGMLARATASVPGGFFTIADAAALPVRASSVDVLTCVTALHLVPHRQQVLAEWRRVVRPGGRVVVATFGDALGPVPSPAGDLPRFHDAFRTPELVADAFAPHGFRLLDASWWTHGNHRLLISNLGAP